MTQQSSISRLRPVIRVFVSSTFSDLKHERDALQREVFPRLEQFCASQQFQFQAIDLRWGISSEAGDDHRTMRICFDELRRSQEVSPEPNFLILLGNRYGMRPLPEEISQAEYEQLAAAAQFGGENRAPIPGNHGKTALQVLRDWYRCDENVLLPLPPKTAPDDVPLNYILQPRTQDLHDGRDYTRTNQQRRTYSRDWRDVQQVLRRIIEVAFPVESLDHRFDHIDWSEHVACVNDRRNPRPVIPQIVRFQASATEQEIWCGALSAPNAERHVLAFFRDITNRDGFAPQEARDFYDLTETGEFDESAAKRQHALRTAIGERLGQDATIPVPYSRLKRESGKVVVDASEADTKAFCNSVFESLRPIIERQIESYWRTTDQASPDRAARDLEIEQREYDRFAEERGGEESFVGRQVELQAILDYVGNDSRWPLVIHGASGCGKTAILARASQEVAKTRKRVERFIGVAPRSSDLRSLLSSLCQELRQRNPRADALPIEIHELRDEFSQHLQAATPEQPLILFLDALDQLADVDNGRRLNWLPLVSLPAHVKLVVSCLSDRATGDPAGQPYAELKRRPIAAENFIHLDVLSETEARLLLFDRWFLRAGRKVSDEQRARIEQRLASPACRQPIFLKLLFDEVQLWHSYDPATVPGESVPELLGQLFERLSQPTNHGALLVNRVLGYLSASRHGLAENEILEILFADPEYRAELNAASERTRHELPPNAKRIPIALWSRLRFDIAPYLTERAAPGANVLTFYHRQVAEWVQEHLATPPDQSRQSHLRLADYFDRQPTSTRRTDELPWQLNEARLWDRLFNLLRDLDMFDALWQQNSFDLKRYWTQMEAHSDFRMTRAYYLPSDPASITASRAAIWVRIARLLYDTDYVAEASVRIEAVVDVVRRAGILPGLQAALGVLGLCRAGQGCADQALDAFMERESICRQLGDLYGLQESLAPQGLLQVNKGDFDAAKRIYEEHENLCRRIGDLDGLQVSLGDQVVLFSQLEEHERCLSLEAEEEALCRSIGHRDGLARSLMNKSSRLLHEGQLPEAEAAATEAEKLHRELGNRTYRLIDLKHLGDIDYALDKPMGALFHYEEGERLAHRLGKIEKCAEFLVDEGRCHAAIGHLGAALKQLQHAAELYGSLGRRRTKAGVLELMLQVHRVAEEVVPTIETLADLESEYRELGDDVRLARCLYQQAAFYLTEDAYKPERSLQLLAEAGSISQVRNLSDLLPEIEKLLIEARKRAPTSQASSTPEIDRDLKGMKIGSFRIQSATTDRNGTHVLGAWDEIRQRRFLIRIGPHNPIWTQAFAKLDRLGNLREQADRIRVSFQSRLAAGQAIGALPGTDRTDVLMVSKTGRLVLLNEPHWPQHALRVEELDTRAAEENIPLSTRTVRGAFEMQFLAMIARCEGKNVTEFTDEDLPLLADQGFLTEIGEWIKRLDRRNNAGGYAEALDRVITGVGVMTLTGGYPPIRQNTLILLMGLGESGRLSVEQFRQTLFSKEFFYNLAPSYIQQVEAMVRWIERVDLPAEVVRNYRWLCNQAWQLYRTGRAPEEEPSLAKKLDPPEPAAFNVDAMCVEAELD